MKRALLVALIAGLALAAAPSRGVGYPKVVGGPSGSGGVASGSSPTFANLTLTGTEQMATGQNLCLKSGGLNCLSSDGTAVSLNSGRLDGNASTVFVSLDINTGISINYGSSSVAVDSSSVTETTNVANSGTAFASQVRQAIALTSAGSVMERWVNNGVIGGVVDAPSGFFGVMPVTDGGVVELTAVVRAPTPNTAKAEEYGIATLSGSAIAVTFGTPFASAPVCFCDHVAAVPIACGPTAAAAVGSVTFAVAAGSGNVNWRCIGAR